MIQSFDYYRQSEKPEFILCNPDDIQLCALTVEKTSCTLRYNDTSELSFVVQEGCSDGYDLLAVNRQVLVTGLGYFIIDSVTEDNEDGEYHGSKSVNAKSAQYTLSFKIVDYVNGVLPFYDSTHTSETGSFMEHILDLCPGWSFQCDSALESKYRSIEITKRTVLDSLYSVASEAYQCIFTFDFLSRIIRADAISNLTKDGEPVQKTDIYLSFDNVVDGLAMKESADDVKTKLFVYGQDLDIRQVNPLGTAYLLNLDYYANSDWMDDETILAYQNWKKLVSSKEEIYADKLTELRERRAELTKLQADLVTEEGVKAEYDNLVSVKIEGGYTNDTSYRETVAKVNEQAVIIKGLQEDISILESEIESILAELSSINKECLPENVFSDGVYKKLSCFFREGEYSNDNYVVTDLMTAEDIQDQALELYEEGKQVLDRASQPAFTLSVDAKAFIHMDAFSYFTNQLELGCMVTVEKNDSIYYTPILLEMEFSWDDKEDFSLSFGNRFHLDDAGSTYEELLGNAASTSSTISANWDSIVDFKRNYKSQVADILNNAFNVALRSIVSSENQDIVWDASGLTCRKWNEDTGTYDNEQFKIINNMIAFTDDGWNTLKTIIGKIALDPEQPENTKYGIAAEVLVGQLLAGENLVIANDSGTFRVDGDGVYFGVQLKNEDGSTQTDEDGNPITVDLKDYFASQIEAIEGDVNNTNNSISDLESALGDLENKLTGVTDGKINSWYQADMPCEEIQPENAVFVDNELYQERVLYEGDLWYNTNTNLSYRYTKYGDEESGYYFLWSEFAGVPESVFDKIDGKRSIYTSVPADGFCKDDLWIFDPDKMTVGTSNYTSPSGAEKDDLLVATADSLSVYNAELWVKYSTNIEKNNENGFSFKLNNDGMALKNGDITMEGKSTNGTTYQVQIDPSKGFKISKKESSVSSFSDIFYVDSETGNVIFKGKLSGASGSFSGSLEAASGVFTGKLEAATGSFSGDISGASGTFKGALDVGDGNFTVDSSGNLTAKSGTFSGTCTWNGNNIDGGYLNLKGVKVTDNNNDVTFEVDSYGNVTVKGNITLGSGSSISWDSVMDKPDNLVYDEDISGFEGDIQNAIDIANGADANADKAIDTANSASDKATDAQDNVEALANGKYTSGTFISGNTIYSPNILSDNFVVTPFTKSGMTGGITINGYFDNTLYSMFKIYYMDAGTHPNTVFECQQGYLYFASSVIFGSGVTIDFNGATVKGLTVGSTAVFG